MLNYQKIISFRKIDEEFAGLSEEISRLELPKNFSQFVLYAVSELLINVKEHSQANNVIIEIFIKSHQSVIRIEDNGIGLRKSYLLKKIYPKSDSAAIEFALSGFSTKDSQQRGFGLFSIRKLVDYLNGLMTIRTGQVSCLVERNKITFKKNSKRKSGLLIILKAPIKPLDFYKIIR